MSVEEVKMLIEESCGMVEQLNLCRETYDSWIKIICDNELKLKQNLETIQSGIMSELLERQGHLMDKISLKFDEIRNGLKQDSLRLNLMELRLSQVQLFARTICGDLNLLSNIQVLQAANNLKNACIRFKEEFSEDLPRIQKKLLACPWAELQICSAEETGALRLQIQKEILVEPQQPVKVEFNQTQNVESVNILSQMREAASNLLTEMRDREPYRPLMSPISPPTDKSPSISTTPEPPRTMSPSNFTDQEIKKEESYCVDDQGAGGPPSTSFYLYWDGKTDNPETKHSQTKQEDCHNSSKGYFLDTNNTCAICRCHGKMIMCHSCLSLYHPKCHTPVIPPDDKAWMCHSCSDQHDSTPQRRKPETKLPI